MFFLSLRGRYDRSNLLEIKRLLRRSFLTPRNDSLQLWVFVQTLYKFLKPSMHKKKCLKYVKVPKMPKVKECAFGAAYFNFSSEP